MKTYIITIHLSFFFLQNAKTLSATTLSAELGLRRANATETHFGCCTTVNMRASLALVHLYNNCSKIKFPVHLNLYDIYPFKHVLIFKLNMIKQSVLFNCEHACYTCMSIYSLKSFKWYLDTVSLI